jgi:hypothetical protein
MLDALADLSKCVNLSSMPKPGKGTVDLSSMQLLRDGSQCIEMCISVNHMGKWPQGRPLSTVHCEEGAGPDG